MRASLDPFSFILTTIAGWMSQYQQKVIAYLIEENRVLREQVGDRRVRFNDDQRRRLAAKAKQLGRETGHIKDTLWSLTYFDANPSFCERTGVGRDGPVHAPKLSKRPKVRI